MTEPYCRCPGCGDCGAADHERDSIVHLLRVEATKPGVSPDERRFAQYVIQRIKAGEHLKEKKP